MGLLDGESSDSIVHSSGDSPIASVDTSSMPQFLPPGLAGMGICSSQADLDNYKEQLKQFKQVVAWSKSKFNMARSAADLALELTRSRNKAIAYFAQTAIKQAKSDAHLRAILQAMPEMLQAVFGTVAQKKEKKVADFRARLESAGSRK